MDSCAWKNWERCEYMSGTCGGDTGSSGSCLMPCCPSSSLRECGSAGSRGVETESGLEESRGSDLMSSFEPEERRRGTNSSVMSGDIMLSLSVSPASESLLPPRLQERFSRFSGLTLEREAIEYGIIVRECELTCPWFPRPCRAGAGS